MVCFPFLFLLLYYQKFESNMRRKSKAFLLVFLTLVTFAPFLSGCAVSPASKGNGSGNGASMWLADVFSHA
jgi:hypothetical protein